ncbi:MAG: MBOAT family protein [Rhodospirillales bacterium]|nr:MBOAT family protein [Rhodospirillales bacterium]
MLFNTPVFVLGFLPAMLAVFFLAGRWGGVGGALAAVIGGSLVFYAWWNPPYVLLLGGSILVNYALARRIDAARPGNRARRWLIVGLVFDLGLLGVFKYADFVWGSLAALTGALTGRAAPASGIVLPLAISFFTFQQVMFLVDTARSGCPARNLRDYAAFIAFFPHLIAGPIVRPAEIIAQLRRPALARPDAEALAAGATLFLLGLAKKLVLADAFGALADPGFAAAAAGAQPSLLEAWVATLAYALQIYFDFSAYSDMAIGLARMLNVRFPLNFDSPYQARGIGDFWRRWHITLGRFLRDYVYIPLGGNRSGAWRAGCNLMATMLLCGLWHGAAWRFVLWGGLHGVFLITERLWRRLGLRLPGLLAQCLTLAAVILAWVPFRAEGMAASGAMLRGLAGLNGCALPAMIWRALPWVQPFFRPVAMLAHLGDARTLALPQAVALLALGWAIVLFLPSLHRMRRNGQMRALVAGFALSMQGLFFAPHVAPFLYFRF